MPNDGLSQENVQAMILALQEMASQKPPKKTRRTKSMVIEEAKDAIQSALASGWGYEDIVRKMSEFQIYINSNTIRQYFKNSKPIVTEENFE